MATSMDRRKLLTSAALGATALVGATALGTLAPEAAMAATPLKAQPGQPDPNFAEGRITGINGMMLMVTGSDGVLHRMSVSYADELRPLELDAA